MVKKRVIPVLLLNNGRMVKGVNFSDYRDTGDPKMAVRVYSAQDTDELVFININREEKNSWQELVKFLGIASEECFMPLTAGGSIDSVEKIRELLTAGADKVVITTAAVDNPKIITEGAKIYGAQCIITGIDYKKSNGKNYVVTQCGKKVTDIDPIMHAKKLESLGAGEIFLNSIDHDGKMDGYDIETLNDVVNAVNIPVIVCGGAGNFMHLAEAFQKTNVSAVACASLFHFGDNNPIRARSYLKNLDIPMRRLK